MSLETSQDSRPISQMRIFDMEFPRGIGEVDRIIWKVMRGVKSITVFGKDGRTHHHIIDSIDDMRRPRETKSLQDTKMHAVNQ